MLNKNNTPNISGRYKVTAAPNCSYLTIGAIYDVDDNGERSLHFRNVATGGATYETRYNVGRGALVLEAV